MEWDRVLGFKFWSYDSFVKDYANKPSAHPTRRVVILYIDSIESNDIPSDMFKSILDQSVKVDDIAIQTTNPQKFKHMKNFTSTHVPGTEFISEGDASTILIPVVMKIYPYDFVEQAVLAHTRNNPIEVQKENKPKDDNNISALQSAFRKLTHAY